MGRITDEEFRRRYPNITREVNEGDYVSIQSIRSDASEGEKAAARGGYPTAVDFIRLCETKEQAAEIIDYLERRKEISPEYAEKLRDQLNKRGLRSFGKRRRPGVSAPGTE
ncbi:MAG: DUF2095 family protein [Candidatus Hadarchaeales archaeon]